VGRGYPQDGFDLAGFKISFPSGKKFLFPAASPDVDLLRCLYPGRVYSPAQRGVEDLLWTKGHEAHIAQPLERDSGLSADYPLLIDVQADPMTGQASMLGISGQVFCERLGPGISGGELKQRLFSS
jgi:hypothetical protein